MTITLTQNTQPIILRLSTTPFAGPTGPQGPTGATGPAGPQGDTGEGVPAGGSTGDVLSKATGTDYDTEWTDLASVYQPLDPVLTATTASFTTDDETKLDGIETSADVTDTANVTAAGALMDSELADEAGVKAYQGGEDVFVALSTGNTAAQNTTAIAAAVTAWKALINSDDDAHASKLIWPSGEYDIALQPSLNTAVDLGGIRAGINSYIEGRGCVLKPDSTCAGKTIIDLTGSRGFVGSLPAVLALDDDNPPSTGVQFGRSEDDVVAGQHILDNIHVKGFFTRAGVYNGASEVCTFISPLVWNFYDNSGSTAYCWIQDGSVRFKPTDLTDQDIDSLTADTGQSFLLNTFIGADFRRLGFDPDTGAYSSGSGSALWCSRWASHTWLNPYMVSYDAALIVWRPDSNNDENIKLYNFHGETSGHTYVIDIDGYTATPVIKGLLLEINNNIAGTSIFGTDNDTDVTFIDSEIIVRNPDSDVWENEAKVKCYGCTVSLPDKTHWDEPAEWVGSVLKTEAGTEYSDLTVDGAASMGALTTTQSPIFGNDGTVTVRSDNTATASTGAFLRYDGFSRNSNETLINFGRIQFVANDITAGAERSSYTLAARLGGTMTTAITADPRGADLHAEGATILETETWGVNVDGAVGVGSYTVAGLPSGSAGRVAYASDGRKNGEGASSGTGVLVFHDGTNWIACDSGQTVAD